MGFHDIALDADIIFLIFKIYKLQYQEIKHFFDCLKSILRWRLLISPEVENEIEDPFSLSLAGRLIKDGVLERFQSSNKQELREIAQTYNDLRKTMGKGEASCYAIAKCKGYSVLSHDHEAFSTLPPEIKGKVKWIPFYEMIYLLNREGAVSDTEAQGYLDDLGTLPNFTLPAYIQKAGFQGIKAIYDKKYGCKKPTPKILPPGKKRMIRIEEDPESS